MGAQLTWVAILASLALGLGGACLFVFAVKKGYFRNIEDTKYQVFWSDLEDMVDGLEQKHDRGTQQGQSGDAR